MTTPARVYIILAGGTGDRFWPLTSPGEPKQMLALLDPKRSLLQMAVDRLQPLAQHRDIYVATTDSLRTAAQNHLVGIDTAQFLIEPHKRNTAGALVWAAATLLARTGLPPEALTVGVVTADHSIGDDDLYHDVLRRAMDVAALGEALVVVGIAPVRAETGYGYIEAGAVPAAGSLDPVPVAAFREKPDAATAAEYANSGRHFWNGGMFFYRIDRFITELEAAAPEYATVLESIRKRLITQDESRAAEAFATLPDKSIDYVLMERARRVVMVPGPFPWDDLGSWDVLERLAGAAAPTNVVRGKPVVIASQGCIVIDLAPEQGPLAVSGCEGLIVVRTAHGTLVIPKNRAQDVRAIVEQLRLAGR